MSNLGLERKLADEGLALHRTAVGDRYVLEAMRETGCNVGGEQSGHIILTDHATTGDGLVAGLQILAALVESGQAGERIAAPVRSGAAIAQERPLRRAAQPLEPTRSRRRSPRPRPQLDGRGRLVIRKSGTEPLIRVMAEGDDAALVERLVDDICDAVARRPADARDAPRLRTLRRRPAGGRATARSSARSNAPSAPNAPRRCDERCPNCGGDLIDRPTRSKARLIAHPASTARKYKG